MLKEYRLSHNLTQQQMADMLDMDFTCYSRIERHERKMSIDLLIKFLEIRNEENDNIVLSVLKSI